MLPRKALQNIPYKNPMRTKKERERQLLTSLAWTKCMCLSDVISVHLGMKNDLRIFLRNEKTVYVCVTIIHAPATFYPYLGSFLCKTM